VCVTVCFDMLFVCVVVIVLDVCVVSVFFYFAAQHVRHKVNGKQSSYLPC
jgi:hypothetical protein